ncbi:DUF4192 family protein [Nakamurella sp. YIM 132087]|uniref:DUF4192 family protein n=1 Tax=Nakamurella alba TaxID=2665158 RepID=A0A7K1FHR4_9ACTN|nr:DUF4192 domain-containing protein [Nakamurella alba]MTD13665.1 DUF4192 family protein [Nakamurella alba]
MTTTDEPARIRLTGRAGLLAAVPALLGFHPTESLVMLCITGRPSRIGPVLRVDLDESPGVAEHLAEQAGRWAEAVALVSYSERCPVVPPLLLHTLDRCLASGIGLLDAAWVHLGEVRPVLPRRDDPDIGVPVPGPEDPQREEMAAHTVLQGRAVLDDREALTRSVAGPSGSAAAEADMAAECAADVVLEEMAEDMDAVTPTAVALAQLARADVIGRNVPGLGTVAALAAHCTDPEARDAVLTMVVTDDDPWWIPTLLACVTRLTDRAAAPLCAILGVAAYTSGDGAMAQVATERALRGDPHNLLADLMSQAISACLAPTEVTQVVRSIGAGRVTDDQDVSPGADG